MKKRSLCSIILIACLSVGLCCGCNAASDDDRSSVSQEEIPSVSKDIFAMDAYLSLTLYGEHAEAALAEAEETIARLDSLFSVSSEDGEIALANEGNIVLLSEDTETLLTQSLALSRETDGAFDITMYPLMCAWGFPTESYLHDDYTLPTAEELTRLLTKVGADHVHVDGETHTLSLDNGTQIDLGGVAKGYLGDCLRDLLQEQEIDSALLSLGGSTVELIGSKPDGSDWHVAVMDPMDTTQNVGVLSVSDCVVDTSGGYQRNFEKDGNVYWHILDPNNGFPAKNGLLSVTIIGQSGTEGDALSTALFSMGTEKALAYWRTHADHFDAVLIEEDGAITVTEGAAAYFTSERDFSVAMQDTTEGSKS